MMSIGAHYMRPLGIPTLRRIQCAPTDLVQLSFKETLWRCHRTAQEGLAGDLRGLSSGKSPSRTKDRQVISHRHLTCWHADLAQFNYNEHSHA